jgi:hypothetical protein
MERAAFAPEPLRQALPKLAKTTYERKREALAER